MITSSALWVGPYGQLVVTGALDDQGYVAWKADGEVGGPGYVTAEDARAAALRLERGGYRLVSASGSMRPLDESPTRPSTPMAIKGSSLL